MRKIVLFTLILTLLLSAAVFGVSAAAYEPVKVDIQVEIINGGTAQMTAEVNCPLPEKPKITVDEKETDMFHVFFTEKGTFSYLIQTVPDERDILYDSTVYNVKVYVTEKDGKLYPATVIYNMNTGKKYEGSEGYRTAAVSFENVLQSASLPTEPTQPSSSNATEPPSPKTTEPHDQHSSRPKTGDNGMLDLYLLICILASAGLFALSLSYLKYVNRMINR